MTKLRVVTSPSGARFTVADEYGDKFSGLVADLEAAGYGINPNASGGYNPRNIRGSRRPSNHAFGRAIDVNWDRNALGTKGEINPELARSLAAKHGMTWGGDWSRPDPMHFEIAGVPNVPVSQRGITRVAGVQKTQPMTTEPLETMPTYKNVGGVPVTSPQEVERQQALAKALMSGGMDGATPRHWSEALGNVLMSGVGMYKGKQAAEAEAQGQTSGNQALGRMLMGGVPEQAAAVSNPYSSERALKYVMDQKTATDQTPSNVREYEYFSKLTPEQQTQYLNVKRQNMGVYGDTIFNKVTGAPVANLGDALKRGKIAEGEGANVAKLRAELPGEKARLGMINGVLDRLDKAANDLRTQPGLETVAGGLYQAYAPNVSEKALNAQTNLENLKVQISGQVLQSMREMSKTGGAVGQVTEREWPRLENMIANLDPRQGVAQFRTNLDAINNYVAEVKARLREAYEADLATAQGGGAQMPPIDVPQGGSVKEYVYDPATGKVVPK